MKLLYCFVDKFLTSNLIKKKRLYQNVDVFKDIHTKHNVINIYSVILKEQTKLAIKYRFLKCPPSSTVLMLLLLNVTKATKSFRR